jgi:hypothetical protein
MTSIVSELDAAIAAVDRATEGVESVDLAPLAASITQYKEVLDPSVSRGIADAHGSELLQQTDRGLEHAARGGDVLAEKHHVRIACHLLGDATGHRISISQFRHAQPPSA